MNNGVSDDVRSPDKTILYVLLIVTLFGNMLYNNVAALLPPFAETYHPKFSSFQIGALFSSYQISLIFIAPYIGNNLCKFGRKRALSVSIVLLSGATFVFAGAGYIEDDWGWYITSFIARSAQGLGDAIILIAIPSIIAVEYPLQTEVYLGYAATVLGFAFAIGPVVADVLFRYFEYTGTLFIFGAMIFVTGTISVCMMPDRVNANENDEEGALPIKDIPYCTFFENRRATMGIISKFFASFTIQFYDPILTLALQDMGMSTANSGLGFAVICIAYSISGVIFGKCAEKFNKAGIIFWSFLFQGISIYISGGATTGSLVVVFIGLFLTGFWCSGCIVPVIPEVLQSMQKQLSPDDPYPHRAESVHTLKSYAPVPGGATQGRSTSYAGRALSRHYSRADSAWMDRSASQAILGFQEKQLSNSIRTDSKIDTS